MTGRADQAASAVAEFDRHCDMLPAGHWLHREMDRVRNGYYRAAPGQVDSPATGPFREEDGFWKTVAPAEAGLDAKALADHREICRRSGADACLVVHGHRIVQEWYSPRYAYPMYAMSSTKSITGLLVGMLLDDGKLDSIEARGGKAG